MLRTEKTTFAQTIMTTTNLLSNIFGYIFRNICHGIAEINKSGQKEKTVTQKRKKSKPVLVTYKVVVIFDVPKEYQTPQDFLCVFEDKFFTSARKYRINFATIDIIPKGRNIEVILTKDPNYILILTPEDIRIGLTKPDQKMNYKLFYRLAEIKKVEKFAYSLGRVSKFDSEILFQNLGIEN